MLCYHENMEPQEKKYRVTEFDVIIRALAGAGAKKGKHVTSVHYYGQHDGSNVEKFVVYPDRTEIHTLTESDGKFILDEHRKISGKAEGFAWLKERGYRTVNIVQMDYSEYEYDGGTVGLYTIDDHVYSVILYYPPDMLSRMEQVFGLSDAAQITVPYNMYLKKLGKLRSVPVT